MDFSAKLSLPYLLPNQAQKHVTMNESLRALDALMQLAVTSITETEVPDAPEDGARYIPANGSTGVWADAAGQLASYQDGAWRFYAPQVGWLAWVETESALYVFDGQVWRRPATAHSATQLGINTEADAFNRLALKAPASLFDHEGEGHQLKINKADSADTASLVFQTAYAGHAELGLAGNNNFNLKVSQDGQSFANAILVRADNGNVGIDTYWPTAKLHVDGGVRIGSVALADLPAPEEMGAGIMLLVTDTPGGPALAISNGQEWRGLMDRSLS